MEDADSGRMNLSLNQYVWHSDSFLHSDKLERLELECLVYPNYDLDKSHSAEEKTPVTVPLCILADVRLRFLCPDDLEEVRELCKDWFPIDYPYEWYQDITSSSRFYALAAVYQGVIIGLIVAEIKPYANLNEEDRGILCSSLGKEALVGYILSLGVRRTYRRNGIATLLLEQLLAHVTVPERSSVKAVFLHVLSSNAPAIHFYQRCHFHLHSFLPYYYWIRGICQDGFTYVLYVNGGYAPWGIWGWLRHLTATMASFGLCRFPRWIWKRILWAASRLNKQPSYSRTNSTSRHRMNSRRRSKLGVFNGER